MIQAPWLKIIIRDGLIFQQLSLYATIDVFHVFTESLKFEVGNIEYVFLNGLLFIFHNVSLSWFYYHTGVSPMEKMNANNIKMFL